MSVIKNPLEIFNLLPKTNCRQCYLPTCLAFSAAVFKGEKKLSDCPHVKGIPSEIIEDSIVKQESPDERRKEKLQELKSEICEMDLSSKAQMVGARMVGDKLVVKCLGKDFFVDPKGNITSECHTHAGLAIPVLSYILHSRSNTAGSVSGDWIPFRELKNGGPRGPLFAQRCEKPLKKIADTHTDLFEDLVSIFSGTRSKNKFSSDISLILYPLPKLPILICYWEPEEDLESMLHFFFDASAEDFLDIDSIFSLGIGLVMMFDKIVQKHI